MRAGVIALGAVLMVGCGGEDIDPVGLPSIQGYEAWPSIVVTGEVPGHGDTVREIYANDMARAAANGQYLEGSVLVKEIYRKRGDGTRGELDYRAVMRRMVSDPPMAVAGLPVEDDGWLYTYLDGDGSETYLPLCWANCHRQAPYEGAWFDYGAITAP